MKPYKIHRETPKEAHYASIDNQEYSYLLLFNVLQWDEPQDLQLFIFPNPSVWAHIALELFRWLQIKCTVKGCIRRWCCRPYVIPNDLNSVGYITQDDYSRDCSIVVDLAAMCFMKGVQQMKIIIGDDYVDPLFWKLFQVIITDRLNSLSSLSTSLSIDPRGRCVITSSDQTMKMGFVSCLYEELDLMIVHDSVRLSSITGGLRVKVPLSIVEHTP